MVSGMAMFQEHTLQPATTEGTIWPYIPRYNTPLHFHPQLEFLVMLRGSARARIGHTMHAVHAGQLIWHLPGIEHQLVDVSAECDYRVVQIEPDVCAGVAGLVRHGAARDRAVGAAANCFSTWARELGWLASGRPVVELKRADLDRILEDCDVTCAHGELSPEQSGMRLRAALESAWRATREDHDALRPNSVVELACCLLLEQPGLERPAVCRALDVSESYLSRRFQAELGVSFLEQRSRLRVVHFVSHVARERQNCLRAALLAGFGSYSQLHRVFAQVVQVSPRAYFLGECRNLRSRQNSI
jgi:AraC-like DNA-binding protein/quercetin dioxygenase-like cupin family protein